jgi:hypothetical protein
MPSVIEESRLLYHIRLCGDVYGLRGASPSNADKDSLTSSTIAKELLNDIIANTTGAEIRSIVASGQELGRRFADHTKQFLRETFQRLQYARPGPWEFDTSQAWPGIARYEPYVHLAQLQRLVERVREENPETATAFSQDYLIMPDLVIARSPWSDTDINQGGGIIVSGRDLASHTPFRFREEGQPLMLHASISCKWTLRSDRAQNARTEALNLIRNRKGRAPHIVLVTAEPLPTRLASIALGTGDIDCVYHIALHELREVLRRLHNADQADMLEQLVGGERLRDVSDLPFDLAV